MQEGVRSTLQCFTTARKPTASCQ